MLEWATESESYAATQLDTVGAADSELQARLDALLTERPWSSTNVVESGVTGTAGRIRKLLKSDRYASKKGPRGAILRALCDTPALHLVGSPDDEVTK